MRISDYLAIIVIVGLTYLVISSKFNPIKIISTDTLFTQGKTIIDTFTVWKEKTIYVAGKVKSDTIYIDTSGKFHAKAKFNIEEDSVKIKGNVFYDEPMFSFSNIIVKYPFRTKTITISRVDTFRITNNVERWFSHGIQVGIGYGVFNKEVDLFIGYGVQVNL